ncbi:hypothetical protein AB0I82_11490 [Streptomyces sp. NPDC050315]|uniref:hypothetical protein n=1 Tax=Streptomyces sp. NPDC050315 TaxID=3155039 RepID=UPI0034375EB2
MRLERGATGFWSHGDEPVAETDVTLLRSVCWEAARRIAGRVSESAFAGASSFHALTITSPSKTYDVLCHKNLSVVAFASAPLVPGQPLSGFGDPPPWADDLEVAGFRCLTVEDLRMPMSKVKVTELAEAELTQIRYWRPEVLGDLLFNWWD